MSQIDPQDPLPEPTWLWRRLYVFAVSIAFLALISLAAHSLSQIAALHPETGIRALLEVIKWLIAALVCVLTYYLVAPSAEQIVKMIQASRIKRTEVECAVHHPQTPSAPEPAPRRVEAEGTTEPPEETPWR